MSRSNAKKLGYLAAGAAILTLFAAQGCSDSNDQVKPTAGAGPTAGEGGKANAGAGGKTSGAGKGGADETGGSAPSEGGAAGEPSEGGMGGEAGAGQNCDGPKGCYSCTPTTNDQLLNHCIPGGCPATFDNSTLSKLNLVGSL
jgi:hypothetical protein